MGYALKKGINDLETWCEQNGETGQRIQEEWDWEENWKNGLLLAPCDLYAFSHQKVWWRCKECKRKFLLEVMRRTAHGQGCSKCGRKRGGMRNHQNALMQGTSLFRWCENNGERGSVLIREWDEERNRSEKGITIHDVTYGCGNKVYWKCRRCGEGFECSISHRVLCNTDCSKCNKEGTSYPEQFLYYGLKQICPRTVNRAKFFGGLEYDIYVPEWNLYIEYGSYYYHRNREEKDQYKKDICLQNGGNFISILDSDNLEQEIFEPDRIVVEISLKDAMRQYKKILSYILKMRGHSITEIDIESVHTNTIKRLGKNVESGKDINSLFPDLIKEWLPELNHGALPENYPTGSHYIINWKCSECGNVWRVSIHSRIEFKTGCPKCRYNIFKKKYVVANHTKNRYKVTSLQQYV